MTASKFYKRGRFMTLSDFLNLSQPVRVIATTKAVANTAGFIKFVDNFVDNGVDFVVMVVIVYLVTYGEV